ncbi:MAG: hypothetical protein ACU0CO_03490 [Shimia sp.]
MPDRKDTIEPIDASFEDVVNAIMPTVKRPPETGTGGAAVLEWSKKLSKTDAQQETTGGLVPYLRLTKGSLGGGDEFQAWFRDEFFGGMAWVPGAHGRETDVEICSVPFEVTFRGIALGNVLFRVTHSPNRWRSNNTPNTWLHWPEKIGTMLGLNDLSGQTILIQKQPDGRYTMALGD